MEGILRRLQKLNISLEAKGEQLDIYDPGGALTAELLTDLKENKAELLALLKGLSRSTDHTAIPIAEKRNYYELSASQRRTYFQYAFDSASLAYNIPQAVVLKGSLEAGRLEEAFNELLRRHEILRTSFELVEDQPVQRVMP